MCPYRIHRKPLDLAAVRNDFGSRNDSFPTNTVSPCEFLFKSMNIPMLFILATLDSELSDTDPMSGNGAIHVNGENGPHLGRNGQVHLEWCPP